MDQVGVGIIKQRSSGSEPQRYCEPSTEGFDQPPVPLLAVTQLAERFAADPQQFFVDYGMIALYGIVVWCLVTPPLVLALYALLKPLLQVMARGLRRPAPKPSA